MSLYGVEEYGVIGKPLKHSWSPEIHAMLASYTYEKQEIELEEVKGFVQSAQWKGLNVTIPYKKEVFKYASFVSDTAKRLGAANTLLRKTDGTYAAYNTDLFGFTYMLERFCNEHLGGIEAIKGAKVLVLGGTGGAAQAINASLEDAGTHPITISRKGENNYTNLLELHSDADLIVNTTPVGMYPKCPAEILGGSALEAMPNLKGVIDAVYNPERTGIMLAAEKLGIPTQSGLVMLVAQAFQSSEIWQQTKLDTALIDQIEAKLLDKMRNVVLIGMPGSGKTSAGRELAALTGRTHIDLDNAFKKTYNKSAAEVIEQEGENAFRKLETAIVDTYGKESSLVISCGGGVVTRQENYDLLHQNGTIVMLDRTLEKLSTKGRPLSASKGVQKLAQERMPLYRQWADYIQPCTGSARGDALEIAQLLDL